MLKRSMKTMPHLGLAPSWLAAAVSGFVLVKTAQASTSTVTSVVALLLAVVPFYFAVSPFFSRLRRWNNLVLFNLLMSLVLVEAVLRTMAATLPTFLVQLLPPSSSRALLTERGLFTNESLHGDGML